VDVLYKPIETRFAVRVFAILLLNQLDALCTLRHLDHGAIEMNPLMAQLLLFGDGHFVLVKHFLVSLGLLMIVLRVEQRMARWALSGVFALFSCLAVYQATLWVIT
jgi:hypothetical protein